MYRLILMPLIKIALPLISLVSSKKLKAWIELRQSPRVYPILTDRPIWIHAASGEIEHAKSLISEFKNKYPQKSILLTYSSISAKKLFQNLNVNLALPLPLDEKTEVTKFLQHFNPLILSIARSDLWPEVLYQCKKMKIPTLFFAVVISKTQNKIWQNFVSPWISVVSLCYQEDSQEAAKRFPKSEIVADGDPRCEQILARINSLDFSRFKHPHLLVLGSTWPEDDKVLIDGISAWIANGNKVVWAPHEVDEDHLRKLEKLLFDKNFTHNRFSSFNSWNEIQILVVDRIGVLLNFYPLAKFAFVGGSFKSKVHSVLEPLLCGCKVSVGPYYQNSKEAVLFQNKGVTTVRHPIEFSDWLSKDFVSDLHSIDLILNQNKLSTQNLVLRISNLVRI